VLVGAGLLARKARAKAWRPSRGEDLARAGIESGHRLSEEVGPQTKTSTRWASTVGYGCTTCIRQTPGRCFEAIRQVVVDNKLVSLGAGRATGNFEGASPDVRMNYLASPDGGGVCARRHGGQDLTTEAIGKGKDGKDVFLKDIWPTQKEIYDTIGKCLDAACSRRATATSTRATSAGSRSGRQSETYTWDGKSTYVQNPPYFVGISKKAPGIPVIKGARCLALLGDSITTEPHLAAGDIKKISPPANT